MILKDFRDAIGDVINEAQLPVDAIYYVMKDIMLELEATYLEEVNREQIAKNLAKQSEEKENNSNENLEEIEEA